MDLRGYYVRLMRYLILGFLTATLLTGCVVIVKNYSGHHNVIDKEYKNADLELEQLYKAK